MTLKGKLALITGASRGIGRATALAIAAEGAHVLLHFGKSKDAALELQQQIVTEGGRADLLEAPLETLDGVEHLVSQVQKLAEGGLDIVVLNAGISKAGSMESHTPEDFDNLFATNVRAPFFLMQKLIPLLKYGSSVVVTTSLAARYSPGEAGASGSPSLPAYAATKGALETLVRQWAAQLGVRGIRVNAVSPGVIATDMSNFTKTEGGQALALSMQALKRIGQAEDVADVIAFMASDKSRWITGASIPVDGGSKL
ncbi:SDR family NAD(P)-dependent oxidoreductase [Granulicella arctica]|uniref:SDR family NAD(P)-dependent oxidoreductase n=1 Tax=Granulicella arctica TaxID=940613 RepID=UPI0021E030F4|nr:SDR family oxidoreductase [Granulicella arctica]